MNLSEMLSYADITQLSSIARQYGCECSGHSKHELIQSILSNVHRKEVIYHSLEQLQLEELRFLNYLLFENIEAFSLEDLLARVQQCRFDTELQTQAQAVKKTELQMQAQAVKKTELQVQNQAAKKAVTAQSGKRKKGKAAAPPEPPSPREMIARFKSQGWLFNGHRAHDRYLFHVPVDFKESYRQSLLSKLQKQAAYCEAPPHIEDESGRLLEDMGMMLDYIAKHQPGAAADGVLHRRAVQQLNEACSIKDELPGKGAWKFGYGKGFGELPERMTLMYDYMWSKKWILLEQDRIVINETIAPKEHIMPISELNNIVLHWLKRYRTPIPNVRALVYWLIILSSSWCSLQSLERLLLPLIKPYYFDSAVHVLHKRLVKPLKHFGILQVGYSEHDGMVLQATHYGRRLLSELYT